MKGLSIMDISLAYRCQLLPDKARNSRTLAYTALLKTGWNKDLLDRELDGALAWAKSQVLVARQEELRRQHSANKARMNGDDALDEMFRAAGCDPADIPRRKDKRRLTRVKTRGLPCLEIGAAL
jgi:hypothetical protein